MKEMTNPGDATQITRDYFDNILIEMRHLDAVKPDTRLSLFGETFATPVMTAALSHFKWGQENGMVLIARAARQADALMWCGMGDEAELEQITATGAKTIKIIKPYAEREQVYRRLKHAEACGVLAVGMDIDHQYGKTGDYDVVLGHPMLPVTESELKDLVAASSLPFIVKGVLSVQDAVKCANAGAAGIVLSHHNGLIPYVVPPLMVLPEIAGELKGKLKIFVDCGIASGADAFKALALGADAVSVGKPLMEAVRRQGVPGAADKIGQMTQELAGIMARTCTADIANVDSTLLRMRA